MTITTVQEAESNLSQLIARANQGEEIVIGDPDCPLARLVPFSRPRAKRVPGGWEGQVWMSEDFDDLPEDFLNAFTDGPL